MKRNKLLIAGCALLSVAGASALASCGTTNAEYALITDVGDIDDESFNQTSWEALEDFCKENNKSYAYYKPAHDSTSDRLTSIDQAVAKGAKVVVCPGYLFEDAVYSAQTTYPDVKFVLIDGQPHDTSYTTYKTESNTVGISFQEELAGFFAGYGIVKDGKTKLGFCGGMAVPAVQRYGSGFIQGANLAATEDNANVTINYFYAGAFNATDQATATMKSWYADKVESVFACGGKVYQSVVDGCKLNADGTWIGVDVDQVNVDSGKVITSAMKGLRESVTSALEIYSEDKWSDIGGQNFTLGLATKFGSVAAKDYVGLPTATASWKFAKFTQAQYTQLIADIKSGTIKVSNSTESAPTVSSNVTVNYVSNFATGK